MKPRSVFWSPSSGSALFLCGVLSIVVGRVAAQPPTSRPVEGLRDRTPAVHVLSGARIVTRPGRAIEVGVIVVRDGVIEAVGADVEPPADAAARDLSGKTIYPGLIDGYGEIDVDVDPLSLGAPSWNEQVHPQLRVAESYRADEGLNRKLRGQGIVARLVAPSSGVLKGRSAVVSTADRDNSRDILKADVAHHVRLTVPPGRGRRDYPNSPMGAVALARQSLYDADWYRRAWRAHRASGLVPRPERNDALEALAGAAESLFVIDAPNELFVLRADRFAREFGLNVAIRGSGNEYRRLEAIRRAGRPILLPVRFPQPPNVASIEASADVRLEDLMHWDLAPENPGRLVAAGVSVALTTDGLSDASTFLASVRRAVMRGLPGEEALRAMTTTPASLLGVSDRLGELAPGNDASFLITDGDLFEKKTRILETWIDGRRFVVTDTSAVDWRGRWRARIPRTGSTPWVVELQGTDPTKLKGTIGREGAEQNEKGDESDESRELTLARIGLRDVRLGFTFPASAAGLDGVARLSAVGRVEDETLRQWSATVAWPDGRTDSFRAERIPADKSEKANEAEETDTANDADAGGGESEQAARSDDKSSDDESKEKEEPDEPASFDVNYPLGAFGRGAIPDRPAVLAVRGATIWTSGGQGIVENATMIVRDGVIESVGQDLVIPAGALVIDARGKHVSPGIIDCHSHMATDGGINESTQAITAEVRIGDFINADDVNIYRQLAGGVTCSNILHGSANPIGGQNQVIKLRWGLTPEELKMAEAPAGIKFALGENVKQSNWGDDYRDRYPQTRMGVEQIIRDAFHSAGDYARRRRTWRRDHQGPPPRRDLELDALAEVLRGERWIHCHSYRQDEILALIRTLDDFQIRIGTFQHILEGYKVADEMARHGAMGSAFSDWWAYKFEVYDAIPYNGALMHEAGVVVSFNSDDRELARHLNHEAAKAMKYGGVPEVEALKFVTLNPARQLRIERFVGSLEPGKHADFVVWSGSPLSNFSRCEQTWIDGRRYFDLSEDQAARLRQQEIRDALIQKILDSGKPMRKPGERDVDHADLWPREDLFCHGHGHGHDHHADHAEH